jgi:hypothetical protein
MLSKFSKSFKSDKEELEEEDDDEFIDENAFS